MEQYNALLTTRSPFCYSLVVCLLCYKGQMRKKSSPNFAKIGWVKTNKQANKVTFIFTICIIIVGQCHDSYFSQTTSISWQHQNMVWHRCNKALYLSKKYKLYVLNVSENILLVILNYKETFSRSFKIFRVYYFIEWGTIPIFSFT